MIDVKKIYNLVFGVMIFGLMVVLVIGLVSSFNDAQTSGTLEHNATSSWLGLISVSTNIYAGLIVVLALIIAIFFINVLSKSM